MSVSFNPSGHRGAEPISLDDSEYSSEDDSAGSLADFIDDDDLSIESYGGERPEKPAPTRKRKRLVKQSERQKPAPKKAPPQKKRRARRGGGEEDLDPLRQQLALKSSSIMELGLGLAMGPVVGRDKEARQVMEMILQPNGGVRPLLLGTAGIGKLSIVEKVATLAKTTFKNHPMGGRRIFCLDCNDLLAHCVAEDFAVRVAGELQYLIDRILVGDTPPVLYFRNIDKILQIDQVAEYVQSILKRPLPFIASISGDTNDEKIAKAITILSESNFEAIKVEEPPQEDVLQIVKNYLGRHRLHPSLSFTESSLDFCVRLAGKYVHTRPFPFKAINLIQESANRVLLQRLSIPGVVGEIQITPADIVQVVSTKTKIPPEDLMEDSLFNERRFVERLREQIVGQDVAIETVCQRVAGYKMGLLDSNKPWGVFLFVGPTGVGKTELAKNLAKLLFNDEKSLICIDGSEYKESHTLSNLIGSPLGYEGHDTGGLLTEPLLKNPHQVVLLDEFEKFHEDVRRLFLQVFDRGTLTDRRGKSVDCTHALFIMTSNIGSDKLFELCQNGELNVDEVGQVLKPILVESLSAELCNRFTAVVPFQPLKKEHLPDVVVVQLNRIKERLASQAHIELVWTPELVRHFVEMDVDLSFGMRDFCRHVDSEVVHVLKDAGCLNDRRLQGKVTLTFKDDQFGVKLLKGSSRA